MNYTVKFQTETTYKSIMYGSNSIYNSACGPASLCNALKALGLADISIPTMCKLAVSCGARVDGGTVMATLLKAAAPKYGFTYTTTSKNAELLAHLEAGGVAILHNGSSYKLFSNSGHFVAAVAASGNTITVLDSYWYDGKYTATALRRNYVSVISKGVIKTSLTQCGKATIDRNPSYYLISREVITDKPTNNEGKDVEDMTEAEVRELIDEVAEEKSNKVVSSWAADSWEKAKKAGVMDGTMPRGNLTREQFAAIMERLGLLDGQVSKVYKTLEDIPEWYRPTIEMLVKDGSLAGTGNGELNLSEDTCRILTVLDRRGVLNVISGEEGREKNYG